MLDDKKLRMIELILEGKHTKTDIAKMIPCSRQSIYDWLDDADVKAEIDTRLQRVRKQTVDRLTSHLEPVVEELFKLAMTAEPRVRVQACKYLVDRVLGTPRNDIMIDDNRDNDSEVDDILSAFTLAVDNTKDKETA